MGRLRLCVSPDEHLDRLFFCTFISYNTAFCSRLIFLLSLLVPFVAAQRREDIFTTLNTSTIVGFLDMFPFFKKNG